MSKIRRITQDEYERAVKNHGHIAKEDIGSVYTTAEVIGYGVEWDSVSKNDSGEYFVTFELGDSCD